MGREDGKVRWDRSVLGIDGLISWNFARRQQTLVLPQAKFHKILRSVVKGGLPGFEARRRIYQRLRESRTEGRGRARMRLAFRAVPNVEGPDRRIGMGGSGMGAIN